LIVFINFADEMAWNIGEIDHTSGSYNCAMIKEGYLMSDDGKVTRYAANGFSFR